MKKSLVSILTIVTVVCIVYGSIVNLKLIKLPSKFFHYNNSSSKNTSGEFTDDFDIKDIKNVNIDCSVADINIYSGKEFSIDYNCTEGLEPKYTYKNGNIEITQNKAAFRKNWGALNNCEINIAIPQNISIDTLDIASDVGDLEISGLTANKMTIDSDTGECKISNCTIDNLTTKSDVGDIKFEDCQTDITDVNNNVGNIELKDITFNSLNATSDVGDIDISSACNIKNYSFDLSSDIGEVEVFSDNHGKKYKISGDSDKKIIAASNIGDVEVK